MISVAGTMNLQLAVIEDFERDVAAMRPQVLTEAGCRHYSLLIENAASGLVNVLEIWDGDDALIAHLKQPWITAFYAIYGPKLLASTVQVYDIAGVRPLPAM